MTMLMIKHDDDDDVIVLDYYGDNHDDDDDDDGDDDDDDDDDDDGSDNVVVVDDDDGHHHHHLHQQRLDPFAQVSSSIWVAFFLPHHPHSRFPRCKMLAACVCVFILYVMACSAKRIKPKRTSQCISFAKRRNQKDAVLMKLSLSR